MIYNTIQKFVVCKIFNVSEKKSSYHHHNDISLIKKLQYCRIFLEFLKKIYILIYIKMNIKYILIYSCNNI